MEESMKKHYMKEEEFLDDFPGAGPAISKAVEGEYEPDYDCCDQARSNAKYFIESAELASLVFDSASIYHESGYFSSAQVVLKSSKRVVTVRIKPSKDTKLDYSTEIIVDKELRYKSHRTCGLKGAAFRPSLSRRVISSSIESLEDCIGLLRISFYRDI